MITGSRHARAPYRLRWVRNGRPQHTRRTLIVLHSPAAAGPPQHVFPWLSPLARHGSVTTVVPGAGSAAALYEEIGTTVVHGFETLTYPRGLRGLGPYAARFARDVLSLGRLMRRIRPDLLIVVTGAVPAALVAARLQGIPSIVFIGEIFDKGVVVSRGRSLAAAATARLTARLADGIVCCSDAVAQQFEPPPSRLLRTIYPGVDGTHGDGDGVRFRMLHDLSGADPCLAVAGNITPARGQDVAIRALARLREELPAARLVIAGDAHARPGDLAYRRELIELARRLGVEERVVFAGLVDPVADLYAAADVVINPARFNEPFGRVAIEALSAGCAVVAARVGAIPEIVRDGREALLFAPEDDEALAGAIIRLWRDAELREKLVHGGRQRIAEAFDQDDAVAAFGDVVERVVGGAPNSATRSAVA